MHLTLSYYHVTYALQSESTFYSFLNVTKPFCPTSQMIDLFYWNVSVWCIGMFLIIMSCMLFRVNPRCLVAWMSRSPCSNRARNLKFTWLQRDSKPQQFSSQMNIQLFRQTRKIIRLCLGNLSLRCIWLFVIIMSHTHFRVNPDSIVAWMFIIPFSR